MRLAEQIVEGRAPALARELGKASDVVAHLDVHAHHLGIGDHAEVIRLRR